EPVEQSAELRVALHLDLFERWVFPELLLRLLGDKNHVRFTAFRRRRYVRLRTVRARGDRGDRRSGTRMIGLRGQTMWRADRGKHSTEVAHAKTRGEVNDGAGLGL